MLVHLTLIHILNTYTFRENVLLQIFTRNRVCIMDAKWVTLYHLKSLKFIRLVLYDSMLTERDVNEFVKHWLNEKWVQLHRFEIRHTSRGEFDLEVLKLGLNVKKWNKNLRNGCYIMDSHENPFLLDTRKDLDVIKSDGTLATIVNRPDTFQFIVWRHHVFKIWSNSGSTFSGFTISGSTISGSTISGSGTVPTHKTLFYSFDARCFLKISSRGNA
nr:hypothetical protein C29A12.2 - Caenorhabditis elegans [Caenorhabditis elegans]